MKCFALFAIFPLVVGCTVAAPTAQAAPKTDRLAIAPVMADYALVVHRSYAQAHAQAIKLQKAVDDFLAKPEDRTLLAARLAWLAARDPYSETEAFRYYEGPIDAQGGPEGQLNGWPLNEAYIDYVKGAPQAGIIHDVSVALDEKTLSSKNAKDDEADITTGFHAIEFLLWGQDLSLDSAGQRPATDFAKGDPIRERRRTYLKVATDLVVKDLKTLVDAWAPGQDNNYAAKFVKMDTTDSLGKVLTGLASLSGFELASERIGVSLDSNSQEDEQSCFSDNTHHDLIHNCQGISNVYLGQYNTWRGKGLNLLVDAVDPTLNQQIEDRLRTTQTLVNALDFPIDRTLASPKGSTSRKKMEALITSLQLQAELFKKAGERLGAEVVIKAE